MSMCNVLHPESSTDAAASTRPRVVILGSGWGGYRLAKVIVLPLSLPYALTVPTVPTVRPAMVVAGDLETRMKDQILF